LSVLWLYTCSDICTFIHEGYSESNFRGAVNKTNKEKKLLYIRNTYILKLLMNLVTAGIEALSLWGNKFLYACVKEVCRLWSQSRFDTLHQLLIITEALWYQPVLQVRKQVLVARGEIRAVRRWSNNSQLKCSSSVRVCIVIDEHYTGCQNSTLFVHNGPTKFFQCLEIHFWRYCGPLLHEFHHQHSFPVAENSCLQLTRILNKLDIF
jgi:hypothetical protein